MLVPLGYRHKSPSLCFHVDLCVEGGVARCLRGLGLGFLVSFKVIFIVYIRDL